MSDSAAAPDLRSIPFVTAEMISYANERWKLCENTDGTTLLRLAILRELVHVLHSEKSKALSTGRKADAQSLKSWEFRIQSLRATYPLEGDLLELLSTDKELKKRTRLLPEAIFNSIAREKLERYDRQWESAIAAEATHAGWKFWSLEAWVEIPLVEEWNKRLNESLWPHGIILFVENASGELPNNSIWQGRWMTVIHPRFRQEDLSLDFSRWPGAPEKPPSPPRWKLLFSPKTR